MRKYTLASLFVLLSAVVYLAVDRCNLAARLETAHNGAADLRTKVKEQAALEADLLTMSSRLDLAEIERELIEDRAADAARKSGHLESRVKTLKARAAELVRTNKELEKEVAHYKNLVAIAVEVTDDFGWPMPPPDLTCKVKSVNTEYKYVMLSAGRDDKVKKGMEFTISRDGRYVGDVQVDNVYPKMCSATIIRLKPGMNFQPGDRASTR